MQIAGLFSTKYPHPQNPTTLSNSKWPPKYYLIIRGVKIGKIVRQFSTKSDDTFEQKSNFSKIFNSLSQIELRATSDEKRLYFRIKSAGSSNYRGATFSPPAIRRQILNPKQI